MSVTFEKFTDRARKAMALANQEAHRLNHEWIGTEHCLLGILKEGSGVAANVLKLRASLMAMEVAVHAKIKSALDCVTMGKLAHTPRMKRTLEIASEEAAMMGHNYVGTEHLVIALSQEHDGVAGQVLEEFGFTTEGLRKAVIHLLNAGVPEEPAALPVAEEVNDHRAIMRISESLMVDVLHLPPDTRILKAEFDFNSGGIIKLVLSHPDLKPVQRGSHLLVVDPQFTRRPAQPETIKFDGWGQS